MLIYDEGFLAIIKIVKEIFGVFSDFSDSSIHIKMQWNKIWRFLQGKWLLCSNYSWSLVNTNYMFLD